MEAEIRVKLKELNQKAKELRKQGTTGQILVATGIEKAIQEIQNFLNHGKEPKTINPTRGESFDI